MQYPLHLSSQLGEHLRALRKERGLTQAGLGRLVGVGQARIAEIEGNPGVVSLDQLMKVLSALRSSLVLEAGDAAASGAAAPLRGPAQQGMPGKASTPFGNDASQESSAQPDTAPATKRHVVIRPKKGAW